MLFDALMAIEVTRRAHPTVTLEACAASANAKLRRRTPYIFGGPPAATTEDAEAAWQAAKKAEREAEAAAQQVPPPAEPVVEAPLSPSPPAVIDLVEPSSRPGAAAASRPFGDSDAEDQDASLAEWEADFRRGVGPPSDDDASDDD